MKRLYLVELRKRNTLTQEAIASKIGIATNSYCMIENGSRRSDLPISLIQKFSEIFKISQKKVLQYENELKANETND